MNKNENIRREVDNIIDQFGQAESLPPDPCFYTRLKARLDKKSRRGTVLAVLKPAFLSIVLAANLITFAWYYAGSGSDEKTGGRQQLAEVFSNDFGLESGSDSIIFIE